MSDQIECATHGHSQKAYVCTHLLGESAGLGFNRNEPTSDKPFPDAWCDDCELIRVAHDGWNDESQKLVEISLLCSGCYERARIRNTRASGTLDNLEGLRWKCGSCDEWHTGPCLDFSYDSPQYWLQEYEEASHKEEVGFDEAGKHPATFLDGDYCAINGHDFFVRGIIHLPIIGTAETLRWGVWGSLSRENFETLFRMNDDPKRVELPPMFSWLSTRIPEYPDTLSLKMYVRIKDVDWCPHFELEPSDHPLSREYHEGITVDRVKQIIMGRLGENE